MNERDQAVYDDVKKQVEEILFILRSEDDIVPALRKAEELDSEAVFAHGEALESVVNRAIVDAGIAMRDFRAIVKFSDALDSIRGTRKRSPKPAEPKESCAECRFWVYGDCRRRAPTRESSREGQQRIWPSTMHEHWCGEFERREKTGGAS